MVVDVPEQVLRYNCGLHLLLEMCFLQAMGFSTEVIASFVRGWETYDRSLDGSFTALLFRVRLPRDGCPDMRMTDDATSPIWWRWL
jgi:hypothetical protein